MYFSRHSIEKLKYIPNASARSLKKAATNSIGIVLADIAETCQAEIFKGISHFLRQNGYIANVAFSDNAAYMECRIIEEFISQNVAGLLLVTCMPDNAPFFRNHIENYDIPTVFIEHRPKGMDVSFVGFANEEAIHRLTEQLLNRRYRRIALVTGPASYSSEADSIRGYRKALEERQIPPACRKAFQSLLQTTACTEKSPLETSIMKTVSDFSEGKTAMLVTYSEYAVQVSKSMYQNIIGQVGYHLLPDRTAVSVGWFLGISPDTAKKEEAFRYFDWLCQKDTSSYMTIMGGQPPVMAPYHSHEMLKLYPWLELTQPGFSCARKRTGPSSSNALAIPQNQMERILCGAFKDVLKGSLSLEDSLRKWQLELESLFKSYGYPKPLHFLR